MNQFIDDFYDVLFKPSRGMARVAKERTVWHGLLVYLAVSLVSTLTALGSEPPGMHGELARFFPGEAAAMLARSMPVLSLISILVFSPLLLFVWSAVLHFSGELLGGRGRATSLTAVIGYAQLPYLLVAPTALAARYLSVDIVGLAGLVAFIWSILLKIEGIRVVHDFSRRRAALAYFLPFLAALAAFLVFLLLLGAFLMPLLSQLFPIS